MAEWYVSSVDYAAVPVWTSSTVKSIDDFVRPTSAGAGNERVFRCTTAGTTNTTQPTWNNGTGATTNDNTVVWTEVTGNSAYGWTSASPRLYIIVNVRATSGDTIYIGDDCIDQLATTYTITPVSTFNDPINILCVSRSSAPPTALSTGAIIGTSGNASVIFSGLGMYMYGITVVASSNRAANANGSISIINTNTSSWCKFEDCVMYLGSTYTAGYTYVNLGVNSATKSAQSIEFVNVNYRFSSATQAFRIVGDFSWKGGRPIAGHIKPITLFQTHVGTTHNTNIIGVDVSNVDNLLGNISTATTMTNYGERTFRNCLYDHSKPIIQTPIITHGGQVINMINCGMTASSAKNGKVHCAGSEFTEYSIYRVGGSRSTNGRYSRKIVTTSYASYGGPYTSIQLEYYNTEHIGTSMTMAIRILTDGITLKDNEAWIQVEYFNNNGVLLPIKATDRNVGIIDSATDQASDTSQWVLGDISSPVYQILSVTITPQDRGLICGKINIARPSTTVYYDPLMTSFKSKQYQVDENTSLIEPEIIALKNRKRSNPLAGM